MAVKPFPHIPPKGRPNGGAKRRFPLIPFNQITIDRTPAYLVQRLIPREGLVVVWGPPKCGKTFWTFDLLMHIALAWLYRGRRVRQGGVVYIACEGANRLGARKEAWRQAKQLDASAHVPFWLLTTRLGLASEHETLIEEIRSQVGDECPAVVAIDTLNRSIEGSESKDEDMGEYIRAADAIREAFHCTVIIIHHCGLDERRPRGHTSLAGATDAQIAIRNNNKVIIAEVEFMKDGDSGDVITSRLKCIHLGEDEEGTLITSLVIEPADEEAAAETKRLTKLQERAKSVLTDLIAAEGTPLPLGNGFPDPVNGAPILGVHKRRWQDECEARALSLSDNPRSRAQSFHHVVNNLLDAQVIAIRNDIVWLAAKENG